MTAIKRKPDARARRIHYVNATVNHVQQLRRTRKGDPVYRLTLHDQDGNVFVATTHTRGTYHHVISESLQGQRVKLAWHHDTRGNKVVLDLEGAGSA